MMRALMRDGAVYALGSLVMRGLGLILLPLFTRALTPEDFGLLDLILTAGVLVNLVVPLETSQGVARFWNERAAGAPRRRLAGTGLLFSAAAYGVFLVAAGLAAEPLGRWLTGQAGVADAIRAGAVFTACNGLLITLQGQLRWAMRPRAYAVSGIAYAVLMALGMAGLLFLDASSVQHVLWLQAAVAAAVATACAWALRDDWEACLDQAALLAVLKFSVPLVPAGIAAFSTLNLHRFVLNAYSNLGEVGLFGLGSRLASVATLVLLGVQGALTPLVYAHHREPETPLHLAQLFEIVWGLSAWASLALALFGREILLLLATSAYANTATLVVWLAPAALMSQLYIFAPGIPLANKTHWQIGLTLASGGLGLLCALCMVPTWQALGAAMASWVGAAAFLGLWVGLSQRLYPLPLRWRSVSSATAAFVVCAWLAVWLNRPGSEVGPLLEVQKLALLAALTAALFVTRLWRWAALQAWWAARPSRRESRTSA